MQKNQLIVASTNRELYTTKRLLTEARALSFEPTYLNPYQTSLLLSSSLPLMGEKNLYFHRTTGVNFDDYDLVVSQFFENQAHQVSNPLSSIEKLRNKDRQILHLKNLQLPLIESLTVKGPLTEDVHKEIVFMQQKFQTQSFILKNIRGNKGIGVSLIHGMDSLLSLLETFQAMNDQRMMIQPYIPHEKEFRVVMTRKNCLAVIEKTTSKNDFRANANRAEKIALGHLPENTMKQCLAVMEQFKLDHAGIDILISENLGPLFIEVNPILGFEQAEELSKVNIAKEMIVQLMK